MWLVQVFNYIVIIITEYCCVFACAQSGVLYDVERFTEHILHNKRRVEPAWHTFWDGMAESRPSGTHIAYCDDQQIYSTYNIQPGAAQAYVQ